MPCSRLLGRRNNYPICVHAFRIPSLAENIHSSCAITMYDRSTVITIHCASWRINFILHCTIFIELHLIGLHVFLKVQEVCAIFYHIWLLMSVNQQIRFFRHLCIQNQGLWSHFRAVRDLISTGLWIFSAFT